jgi:hypothetical protein
MQKYRKPNPLIFIPSPRDIPDVVKHWLKYEYDTLFVKYKPERVAYDEIFDFFHAHKEYTHLIICPDDCEIPFNEMQILMADMEFYKFATISGYANIDETQPDVYALQAKSGSAPTTTGNWYNEKTLPKERFFEVGLATFACQIIRRDLVEQLEWFEQGSFDWQFSLYCFNHKIPLVVDSSCKFYHRRGEQWEIPKQFQRDGFPNGYTVYMRNSSIFKDNSD